MAHAEIECQCKRLQFLLDLAWIFRFFLLDTGKYRVYTSFHR